MASSSGFALMAFSLIWGHLYFSHVHLDPVVDVVDVDRVEAAALCPGIVGANLDDRLLGALGEDIGVVRAVGEVGEPVLVPGARCVDPPVETAVCLHGVDEAVMAEPHAHGPSPMCPARDAIGVAGLAVPGEEEVLVEAVVFLLGVYLLEFRVGEEVRVVPDFDVLELAGPRADALREFLHAFRGVASNGAGLNPLAGLHHVEDLLRGSFLVADFLLYGCRHSAPSLRMISLLPTYESYCCLNKPVGKKIRP